MRIRDFREGDEPALQRVYFSSIREVACHDYSSEQIAAWACTEISPALWQERMRSIQPFVVEDGGEIVAYADLQPTGYIDHFFVSGSFQRRGAARLLMERIHARATELALIELSSHVSRTAQPFFAHFGFQTVEQRSALIRGIELPNALMHKDLQDCAFRSRSDE
jgi:putative acetyltransferase